MATEVDICNIALTNLGEAKIVSLTEATERARLSNLRYPDVRDAVLRSHPWNCATKRAKLTRSTVTPAFGYLYQYSLPFDCLRILGTHDSLLSYQIEGKYLLTDETTMYVKYIAQLTDTSDIDSNLIQAIGLRLAWELAEPLTGRIELKREMWGKYVEVIAEARGIDASEGIPDRIEYLSWVESRWGYQDLDYKPIDSPAEGYDRSTN